MNDFPPKVNRRVCVCVSVSFISVWWIILTPSLMFRWFLTGCPDWTVAHVKTNEVLWEHIKAGLWKSGKVSNCRRFLRKKKIAAHFSASPRVEKLSVVEILAAFFFSIFLFEMHFLWDKNLPETVCFGDRLLLLYLTACGDIWATQNPTTSAVNCVILKKQHHVTIPTLLRCFGVFFSPAVSFSAAVCGDSHVIDHEWKSEVLLKQTTVSAFSLCAVVW